MSAKLRLRRRRANMATGPGAPTAPTTSVAVNCSPLRHKKIGATRKSITRRKCNGQQQQQQQQQSLLAPCRTHFQKRQPTAQLDLKNFGAKRIIGQYEQVRNNTDCTF